MEHHLLFCRTEDDLARSKVAVTAMHEKYRKSIRDESGFTLLEILVVVALIGVLSAMAMMVSPSFTKTRPRGRQHGSGHRCDPLGAGTGDQPAAEHRAACSSCPMRFRLSASTSAPTACRRAPTILRTVELENSMEIRRDIAGNTPDQFAGRRARPRSGPRRRRGGCSRAKARSWIRMAMCSTERYSWRCQTTSSVRGRSRSWVPRR